MAADDKVAAELNIGDCQSDDLEQIQSILRAAPEAAQWSEGALREACSAGHGGFLVGKRGSRVAGFLIARVVRGEAEILNLAVRGGSRRCGVGKALVNHAFRSFNEQGIRKTFLEVRESNRVAVEFYGSLGFRQVGRRETYYHDPVEAALVLARETRPEV